MDAVLLGLALTLASGSAPATVHASDPAPRALRVALERPVLPRIAERGSSTSRQQINRPIGSAARAQATKTKKFSPTDRVIAVAAGVAVGWVVGGAIGFKATSTSNPYDDTSGLKGVMIGAPIGGAAGGILGYWLTNR